MRNAFADEITKVAVNDNRVHLLAADIGNRLFDKFKEAHKNRFYNCGIAEANMISMAAGMAMSGLRPFAYTIAPFLTSRGFEQIKIDMCYHNTNVVIVGTGAGLSYSELGATHHTFEDIGILRTLPNMTIICPADAMEVRLAVRASLDYEGPIYLRMGKKNDPVVFSQEVPFEIGKAVKLYNGEDVCLITTGNTTHLGVEACKELKEENNLIISHIHLHTVKPVDIETLKDVFSKHKLIISIEEHSIIGGLGSLLAEFKNKYDFGNVKLKIKGIEDKFLHSIGKQKWSRKQYGITSDSIKSDVLKYFKEVKL